MRNLQVSMVLGQVYDEVKEAKFLVKGRNAQTTDPAKKTGCVYALCGSDIYEVSLSRSHCIHLYDLASFYGGKDKCPEVVGLAYNFMNDFLMVCTRSGDLLSLSTDPIEVECMATLNGGASSMHWSYDQEWAVFITGIALGTSWVAL